MPILPLLFSALLLIPLQSSLAASSAEALLQRFFSPEGLPPDAYTGHMRHNADLPAPGQLLAPGFETRCRPLRDNGREAVHACTLTQDHETVDWYVYLRQEQGQWKISALRRLDLPDLFFMLLFDLQQKTQRSPEEDRYYQTMRLTLRSDSGLKAYLLRHQAEFEQIARLARTDPDAANSRARALSLSQVTVEPDSAIINLRIGGMLDDAVGYLFVPDGSQPPGMSPRHYIYVEQVTDHWFLYKST